MIRVLLSAVGTMASYSYVHHLKDEGFYVIGINATDLNIGPYICDEFYTVPYVIEVEEYIKAIEKIEFDVFLPWLDEEHILFAQNRFSFSSKIVTSPSNSILVATDKMKTFDFCVANGINTAKLTNTVPAFVRAKFSRGSKYAKLISNQDQLDRLDKTEYLCQEVLSGIEYTVDILCSTKGEFIYAVPRKRLETVNVSTISEIDMNNDIIEFCKQICSLLRFFGPINIQVFKDNNTISLVEINPRMAGTSILSIKAGFDLLTDSVRAFCGLPVPCSYKVKNGLRMYRFYNELYV